MKKGVIFIFVVIMISIFYFIPSALAQEITYYAIGNVNGDFDSEGNPRIDISDPVALLSFLFLGGPAPACLKATDVNADARLDLSDAVYLLNYLFLGGAPLGGEENSLIRIPEPLCNYLSENSLKEDSISEEDAPENLDLTGRMYCASRQFLEAQETSILENAEHPELSECQGMIGVETSDGAYYPLGCVSDGRPDIIIGNPACEGVSDYLVIRYTYEGGDIYGGDGGNYIAPISGGGEGGGAGEDALSATSIYGGSEGDTIKGTFNNDDIHGGLGQDIIEGYFGDDSLDGGPGHDSIYGEFGRDYLYGGDGDDTLHGGGDDDFLDGGFGDDTLRGDDDKDLLYDFFGNNILIGGGYPDIIIAGIGNDRLEGGGLDDYLFGGEGDDTIMGGGGNDFISGDEILDISTTQLLITYSLYDSQGKFVRYDVQAIFENVKNNKIKESEEYQVLKKGGIPESNLGGADTIWGGCGNDIISGDAGNDLIKGSRSPLETISDVNDLIDINNDEPQCIKDNDWILGGLGNDEISGQDGIDVVYGDEGNDKLYGDYAPGTSLRGGRNFVDTVCGGKDKDQIYGDTRGFFDYSKDYVMAGPRSGDDADDLEQVYGGDGESDADIFWMNSRPEEDTNPFHNPPVDINDYLGHKDDGTPKPCIVGRPNIDEFNRKEECAIGKHWVKIEPPNIAFAGFPVINGDAFNHLFLPDCGFAGGDIGIDDGGVRPPDTSDNNGGGPSICAPPQVCCRSRTSGEYYCAYPELDENGDDIPGTAYCISPTNRQDDEVDYAYCNNQPDNPA